MCWEKSEMKKLKVIVIDDEMLIRKLIRMKMDTKRLNLEVAGEYVNGAAALQELREIRPDIVIMIFVCRKRMDCYSVRNV